MRIADLFLRMVADFSGFEKDVVKGAQSAGDKAGLAVGERISGGFSRGARDISRTLGTVGKELTGVGRGMLTNITLPLLAAGGAATKFALDFDTTLRQVVGLTDVTGDEIDGIREKILALGPAVGKGPQELAEAFYFVASAGFKADEAMVVLETSAKAAAAGLGETQTIAQVLGGVINAYGRENITAATAADILTEAVAQGTAEASGLASVIGNVVPGAAALGVSFDQVTAAMAGMTLSGVGVEESATSLIQIFNSLLKPTVQAEAAMNELGLSGAELRRQLREEGLLATLRTLEERFAGNETASAAVFGNIRALRGVTALLTLDSDQLNAVFEKVANSTGRMGEAYDETEGPQREMARSMASLQATAIEFGNDVLPTVVQVLHQIAKSAAELGKWWKSLDEDTRQQVVQWLAWLAVAGPALILIGKLATGLSGLFKMVGFLTGAKGLPALAGAMKKLGVTGTLLVAGIVTLGLELGRLRADEITSDLKLMERAMKAGFKSWDEVTEKAKILAEATGVELPEAIETVISEMENLADRAPRVFGAATKQMRLDLHEWAVDAEQNAGDVGKAIPEGLAAGLEGGKFVVKPAIEEVVDPIQEALQKAKEETAKKAKEIIDALIGGLFEGKQDLVDAWAEIIEIINHPYPDLVRRADIEGKLTATALFDGLHSKDSLAQAKTAEFMLGLIAQYETLEPGALAAGELVNPALQAGIDRNLDALVLWIQQTALPGITDPFDLADELYLMGYEGLAAYVRGVEQARLDKIATAVSLVRRDVKAGMLIDLYGEGYKTGYSWGLGFGASLPETVTKVKQWGGKIKGLLALSSEPKDPESPFRGITKWGLNYGRTIAAGLLRAIPDMVRAASAAGYALAVQPGMMTPAWAGALPTAAGLYGGTSTPALAPGGNVTHIHLNVEGQKPIVSTAVEIAEQAARLGRFKI